eukprot:m.1115808 g.1115808  ORF g.1115808 m.1115808 type:complete len:836 (-) comp24371_c0_seq7:3312-5819(-)
MVLFAFILDTSVSMNQRAANGMTYLDLAKIAIENFIKTRSRDPHARARPDRYMLFTYANDYSAVKLDLNHEGVLDAMHFLKLQEYLKDVTASDASRPGETLALALELLNMNRLQHGIDNFGMGRLPWFTDPTIVVVVTDSGLLVTDEGSTDSVSVPTNTKAPGSNMVLEPFRWDQRIFSIALQLSGATASCTGSSIPSAFAPFCEVSGGKPMVAKNTQGIERCFESINARIAPGVVVSFEPLPRVTDVATHSLPSALHVHMTVKTGQNGKLVGHWPIPEDFWPASHSTIPPRSAHPVIHFRQEACDPQIVEHLPFDKYELEGCHLTQQLLTLKSTNNTCWQCIVHGSGWVGPNGGSADDAPFGYLKPSSSSSTINLVVLPYNYLVLRDLLKQFRKFPEQKPSQNWVNEFKHYLNTTPPYYMTALMSMLKPICGSNVPALFSDIHSDFARNNYSAQLTKLKKLSKLEADRVTREVKKAREAQDKAKAHAASQQPLRPPVVGNGGVPSPLAIAFRNPFDIGRTDLLSELVRMKENLRRVLESSTKQLRKPIIDVYDKRHTVSVAEMGNFQPVIKNRVELRNPRDEPMRSGVLFGNPYKLASSKSLMGSIDEADEGVNEGVVDIRQQNNRRRAGRRARSHSPAPVGSGTSRGAPPPPPSGQREARKRAASEPLAAPPKHVRHAARDGIAASVGGAGSTMRGRDGSGTKPGHSRDPSLGSALTARSGRDSGTAERPPERDTDGSGPGGPVRGRDREGGAAKHGTNAPTRPPPSTVGGDVSIKMQCVREMKKPGRTHEHVVHLVQSVGNKNERHKLIHDLIRVSTNMRKTQLVERLKQLL